MDRLTAMRVFVEVVDAGSQTAAAERLDMSRAMVTRYLAEVENWLGERLLHRTTRRLSLTDAGQDCLARCRQVLEGVEDLVGSAGQRHAEPCGLVRVTTSTSFGRHFLAPAVAAYVERYPRVRVDMLLSDRAVNLIEERIDLAIRFSNDLDPHLIARRLGICRSVICASPAYLARHGAPQTLADLARHNCLTHAYFGKSEWHFTRNGVPAHVEVSGNLSANEVSSLLELALAGAGIAEVPLYIAGADLERGTLVPLLPEWQPTELGIHGVYASRRYQPPILRTLLDYLAERLVEV